eukprot:TRINITY_DN30213_c0_g1_i3.p1 TRINITY_DN30213_c0_g1~~TRINITY_DN30213_c0_g1_i3.p1  ORF type:complete len:149 (-),score=26.04 TRINITY_DN30213_c0_g1_i3:10-456(-)
MDSGGSFLFFTFALSIALAQECTFGPSQSIQISTSPAESAAYQTAAANYASLATRCNLDITTVTQGNAQVAAVSQDMYNNGAVCGSFYRVSGPLGSTTVQIIDISWSVPSNTLVLSSSAGSVTGVGSGEIGRAVQQECRDRSRMPSSA